MRKKLVLAFLILLGALAAVLTIQSGLHMVRTFPEKARLVNAAMPVEMTAAAIVKMDEVIGATGEVQQISTVSLTSNINSRILEIAVDLGAIVQKGDLLIRWDKRLFEAVRKSAVQRVQNADVQMKHALQQLQRLKTLRDEGMGSALEVEEAEVAVSNARFEQAGAEEDLMRANLNLEHTTLVSPVGGVVLGRLANPGENTTVDQPLLTIGELDNVLMVAHVGEEKIGSVYLGQKAEVSFDAYAGERFEGQVVKIDPKTDTDTRSFKTFIKISNPDLRLKPGLTGFAKLFRRTSSLAIPSIALMNPAGDHSTVFVVGPEGRAQLRKVKVGMVSKGLTEIMEGLEMGETVVTVGQLYLREDDRVNSEAYSDAK
jgi:membrane fusion protein, multidrug efflux system